MPDDNGKRTDGGGGLFKAVRRLFPASGSEEFLQGDKALLDDPPILPMTSIGTIVFGKTPESQSMEMHDRFAGLEAETMADTMQAKETTSSGSENATSSASGMKAESPSGDSMLVTGECITPTVSKLARLIAVLPPTLTQEQVRPLIQVAMETSSISFEDAQRELVQGRNSVGRGIAAAKEAVAHAQTEADLKILQAQQLIERARQRRDELISEQQKRVERYEQEKSALMRIAFYLNVNLHAEAATSDGFGEPDPRK